MDVEYPVELQQRIEGDIPATAPGRHVAGRLTVGQVWTLDDLAQRYQAPVGQVQRVMLAARRKGLAVETEPGSCAFRILGVPTTEFASVFTHTAASGLKPRSEVRKVGVEPATATVAGKLRVEVGSPVYRYVRTRWVQEQALANQTNHMPFDICPGLEGDDVTRYSFQKLLEGKYHAVLVEMQEQVRLVPAASSDCEVLGLPSGASVLVIDRLALGATGWPLVWAEIRIRPDRFDYVAALWPQAAELLPAPPARPPGG